MAVGRVYSLAESEMNRINGTSHTHTVKYATTCSHTSAWVSDWVSEWVKEWVSESVSYSYGVRGQMECVGRWSAQARKRKE